MRYGTFMGTDVEAEYPRLLQPGRVRPRTPTKNLRFFVLDRKYSLPPACIYLLRTAGRAFRQITAACDASHGKQFAEPLMLFQKETKMTTNSISLGEQLRTNFVGAVDKAKEVSEEIRERVGSGYRTIHQGLKHAKVATEDAIEGARHEIKERPLTVTTAAAIGGFAIGLLAGWVIASRRK
jgi:ElaB/YqjD/DUF883 family membrane-anchored ribosome-binding protein